MQFQFSNCLPGKGSSPTEKRFDLRPASTPAQLSALDLESIESGMAHTDLADFALARLSVIAGLDHWTGLLDWHSCCTRLLSSSTCRYRS